MSDCCCPSLNALRCAELRYPGATPEEIDADGPCECVCHDPEPEDEDRDDEDVFIGDKPLGYGEGYAHAWELARLLLDEERRRHREALARLKERQRRKDLQRMVRAAAAEPGLVEPDRLLWRARAMRIIARAKGRRCSLYGTTPLQPRMSDLVRRHQDDRRIYGPRGPLPG